MSLPVNREDAGFKIAGIVAERMVCDGLTPEELVGHGNDAVTQMFMLGESLRMLGFKEAAEIALAAHRDNQG